MAKKAKKVEKRSTVFKFFKVLLPSYDRKSWTGGNTSFDYTPFLPTKKGPGKWLPVRNKLRMCAVGWHVTRRPHKWYQGNSSARVFTIETKGVPTTEQVRNYGVVDRTDPKAYFESDKRAYRSIRLVKELTGVQRRKVLLASFQRMPGVVE